MLLLPDSSSIIFNSVNFVLLGSRVNGNKIMLHSTDTLEDGINLCGSDTLLNNGITFEVESVEKNRIDKVHIYFPETVSSDVETEPAV